jgi:hypothetical protein
VRLSRASRAWTSTTAATARQRPLGRGRWPTTARRATWSGTSDQVPRRACRCDPVQQVCAVYLSKPHRPSSGRAHRNTCTRRSDGRILLTIVFLHRAASPHQRSVVRSSGGVTRFFLCTNACLVFCVQLASGCALRAAQGGLRCLLHICDPTCPRMLVTLSGRERVPVRA